MKILIIGASSYVGARLYFDLKDKFEVIGTYNKTPLSSEFIQLDITIPEAVDSVIINTSPDYIVHVANYPSPAGYQDNEGKATAVNRDSTEHVVESANKINARVIFISSFAAIRPTNKYGEHKLASEKIIKNTKAGYIILRPALILGYSPNTENDRSFNRILKNLTEGTKAEYDTSWEFQPTYLGHLSEVINGIIEKDITNEVIPVTVTELKSRFDVARDILTHFDIEVYPINNEDTTPILRESMDELYRLRLPKYTYKKMISKIVDEIENRDKISLA